MKQFTYNADTRSFSDSQDEFFVIREDLRKSTGGKESGYDFHAVTKGKGPIRFNDWHKGSKSVDDDAILIAGPFKSMEEAIKERDFLKSNHH